MRYRNRHRFTVEGSFGEKSSLVSLGLCSPMIPNANANVCPRQLWRLIVGSVAEFSVPVAVEILKPLKSKVMMSFSYVND